VKYLKLPQIRIQSENIKIGQNTTNAQLKMDRLDARQEVKQSTVRMIVETIPSKLTIDQNRAWSDMDLKSVFERTEEAAELGYQAWLEGMARESQEGDAFMKIHNKSNPIVEQALANSVQRPFETGLGYVPSYGSVKINFSPSIINIDWDMQKAVSNYTPGGVDIEYTHGKVDREIEKRNSLKIDFTNIYA
jgi:hypothetical protein